MYKVKYRNSSGSIVSELVDVSSRKDAFAVFEAKGIHPISIEICNERTLKSSSYKFYKIFLVILFSLSFSVSLFFFFTKSNGEHKREGKTKESVSKKNSKLFNSQFSTNQGLLSSCTQNVSQVQTSTSNNDEQKSEVDSQELFVVKDQIRELSSKQVFKSRSDQILAMALARDDTHALPPLPPMNISNEEFLFSLTNQILILDSDSSEVKSLKQAVLDAREEVAEALKKGQTVNEIIQEHVKLRNENYTLRRNAQNELRKLFNAGDIDSAKNYLQKMNETFSNMGITPLKMPLSQEEKKVLRAERQARYDQKHSNNIQKEGGR